MAKKTKGGSVKKSRLATDMGAGKTGKESSVVSLARGQGKRYNSGKIRYDLIPTPLLESTARVFEYGASKYDEWNWLAGMKYSTIIGCMKRHLAKIEIGEDIDEESGYSHVGHIICNALMLKHYMKTYPEGDDRPTKWFKVDK